MDVAGMAQLVTTLGFPIVACFLMGYYVKLQTDYYRSDIRELQSQHKDEMLKVTEAVNNNTLALTKLSDALIDRGYLNDRDNDRTDASSRAGV